MRRSGEELLEGLGLFNKEGKHLVARNASEDTSIGGLLV
jgi:hypothetical protein